MEQVTTGLLTMQKGQEPCLTWQKPSALHQLAQQLVAASENPQSC